jgi:hypothetical protein
MTIRTQLKAGIRVHNHNEALQVRSALKAGGKSLNHNEALQVRSTLKAGGVSLNHNEALQVRSSLKAGGKSLNHNEALRRGLERPTISMRRQPRATGRKEERLELLVVRAGLRAGRKRGWAYGRSRNRF